MGVLILFFTIIEKFLSYSHTSCSSLQQSAAHNFTKKHAVVSSYSRASFGLSAVQGLHHKITIPGQL